MRNPVTEVVWVRFCIVFGFCSRKQLTCPAEFLRFLSGAEGGCHEKHARVLPKDVDTRSLFYRFS
eukprot:COSAG02_NODE_3559_length_6563_cov_4.152382_9_plen_65_part_00